VLEGRITDTRLFFVGAKQGASHQLMLSAWDVERDRPAFEGAWLWGVKPVEGARRQTIQVKTVAEGPWLAGVSTDGTAFLVQAATGKFQWFKKIRREAWPEHEWSSLKVVLCPEALVWRASGPAEGLSLTSGSRLERVPLTLPFNEMSPHRFQLSWAGRLAVVEVSSSGVSMFRANPSRSPR